MSAEELLVVVECRGVDPSPHSLPGEEVVRCVEVRSLLPGLVFDLFINIRILLPFQVVVDQLPVVPVVVAQPEEDEVLVELRGKRSRQ